MVWYGSAQVKRDWETMAIDIGVAPPYLLKQVKSLSIALQAELTSEGFKKQLCQRGLLRDEWEQLQHVRRYIKQQCSKALKLV